MDILIVFLLLVIAVCMLFKRPISIIIHHRYDQAAAVPTTLEQPENTEQPPMNLDSVIRSINDIMEVDQYGQDRY